MQARRRQQGGWGNRGGRGAARPACQRPQPPVNLYFSKVISLLPSTMATARAKAKIASLEDCDRVQVLGYRIPWAQYITCVLQQAAFGPRD